jgi:hypothetical protein
VNGRKDSSRSSRKRKELPGRSGVRGIACSQSHEGQGWRPL